MNVPQGSGALAATYSNTGSNTSWDEVISNDLFHSRINNVNFNYTHVLRILDRTVGLGLNLPVGNILSYNVDTSEVFNSAAGMADPFLIFDMNIFGAASMLPEVFKQTPAEDYFGIHTSWSLPLGKYDPAKQTNLVSNRFTSKIVLNYGVRLKSGKNWIDLYSSVRFSGKNNNFYGLQLGQTLSQKPLLGFYIVPGMARWDLLCGKQSKNCQTDKRCRCSNISPAKL